ncbi:hypothetical protein EA756_14770 [Acinetobacter lactucae]|uniref:Uncharacterized protein n=1 Tax=Acinetobacter lactucae TaxID=1785128 RepID=A0A3R9QFA7_9GAMM|nr:hypothetical protein [Acinetobacter lactucae]RSO54754.1 hypothetical protein EA756_14770 [Acinetobacter lactucae]
MTNEVSVTLDNLCNNASLKVKTRLKAIDKVIYGFKKKNVELTVPNVVNALKAIGVNISASSIYNKTVRGKSNPYRVLFDAWMNDLNKSKLSRNSQNLASVEFVSMTDSDYSSIGNDVVKFKVQMLFNELKSARHQINMLKQIHNLPIVTDTGSSLIFHKNEVSNEPIASQQENITKPKIECNQMYIKVLEQFLNGSNKLEYDKDGCLIAKTTIRKDDLLSDINFKDAIMAALNILLNKN